jgi:hypothetical protein
MSAQQQDWSAWDRWVTAHIERAIDRHEEAMVDGTVAYVEEQLKELRTEIAALRADLATAISRGEIASIKGKSNVA